MDSSSLLAEPTANTGAMPAGFSKLPTDESIEAAAPRAAATEAILDASIELQPTSPSAPSGDGHGPVDEDAKIVQLKEALSNGVRTPAAYTVGVGGANLNNAGSGTRGAGHARPA